MEKRYFLLIAFCIIGISGVTFGQTKNTKERRSTIIEIDGYAFLSEDQSIRQIREAAFANAKRDALQRAQTFIKSMTTVENYMMTYDLVESSAEGFVRVLESKDNGITIDNRYHVRIKAEVEYSLNPPEQNCSINPVTLQNAPLSVSAKTSKRDYRLGENIQIILEGNKNFYALIIFQDASGNLVQLLPNQHREVNFFRAGQKLTIPGKTDGFKLKVSPPFGTESIFVFASTAPLGEAPVSMFGNDLYRPDSEIEQFARQTRSVKIESYSTEENKNKSAEFYEVRCEIVTHKK